MTQDHEKLDSDLIVTCVVGTYFMFILCSFFVNCHLNFVMLLTGMVREDPSIKISLIQERINSEFAYKVSYKKLGWRNKKPLQLNMAIGMSHMRNFRRG